MLAWLRSLVSSSRAYPARAVAALSAGVFALGSVWAVVRGSTLEYLDEREFSTLGHNLATTGSYTLDGVNPTAFRPPLWPFLLSLGDLIGIGVVGSRILSVACLALTVIVVYRLGRRIGGVDAGLVAALLVAVYPLMLYTSTTLYPEALALLVVSVGLWAVVEAGLEPTRSGRIVTWSALAGASFGALVLTSPGHIVVAAPAAAWLLWRHRSRVGLASLAVLVVVAVAAPAAWGIRNHARLGSFVPFSTNGGQNLLLGNNPGATGGSGVNVDLSEYDRVIDDRGLDEVEADRYRRSTAVAWIADNPGRATTLYGQKLLNFFSFRNELATGGQRSLAVDAISAVSYYGLLALFALRLLAWRRIPLLRGEGLLSATYVVYAVASAVFFTRIRFRMPVDQLLMIVVACGFARWVAIRRGDRSEPVHDAGAEAKPAIGVTPGATVREPPRTAPSAPSLLLALTRASRGVNRERNTQPMPRAGVTRTPPEPTGSFDRWFGSRSSFRRWPRVVDRLPITTCPITS